LVFQDYLTKYVLIFPITSEDALTIAALLFNQVFNRFGISKKLLSGQGTKINNILIRGILDAAWVSESISSAYFSMSKSSVERLNVTMNTCLSSTLKPMEGSWWDMVMDRVEFEVLFGNRP